MTYPRPYIAISLLLLFTFACGFQLPADTAITDKVSHMADKKAPVTIEITGTVYIRDLNGIRTGGVLKDGSIFLGFCDGEWCFISGTVYKIFRGCTTYSQGRGCQAE